MKDLIEGAYRIASSGVAFFMAQGSDHGGEEFAVILLGTDAKGAMNMAERLRKTVINTTFPADNTTFHVAVSIGISTYSDGITRKEELIERADKALYHAKRSGRNQSVLWSEDVYTS